MVIPLETITPAIRRTIHRIRRGELYYDVETLKANEGWNTTWSCVFCGRSRVLTAAALGDGEEQAFASIDAHHLFFHHHVRAVGIQPDSERSNE